MYGNVIGVVSSSVSAFNSNYTGIVPINHVKILNVTKYERLADLMEVVNDKD